MKQSKIIMVFLLPFIAALLYFLYYFSNHLLIVTSPVYFFHLKETIFEYGVEANILEYIHTNYEIIDVNPILFHKLGKQTINILLKDEYDNVIEKSETIEIKDRTKPIVHQTQNSIYRDELQSVQKLLIIKDKDKKLSIHSTIKSSQLHVIVKDSSNNETTVAFKILDKPVLRNTSYNNNEKKIVKKIEKSKKNVINKLSKKYFLFKNGYDMHSAYKACLSYLEQEKSGLCKPIQNNNVYEGYLYLR